MERFLWRYCRDSERLDFVIEARAEHTAEIMHLLREIVRLDVFVFPIDK